MTHMLTGAVLARTGFNRRAAYVTSAMLIAAELPDIDILWGIAGPVVGLEHHRGITHTFVAVPFEAALVTAAFYGVFRLIRGRRAPDARGPQWSTGWMYFGCLLALLSHLLLDWTNNYGLRPFFPFDPHWFAGSFVFIFEPVMFVLLLAALVMPALLGLVSSEVGSRERFRGRGWAIFALLAIAALYGFRWSEHASALRLAEQNTPGATRWFASPHPLDPFTWSTVADSPDAYRLASVDTHRNIILPGEPGDTLFKPQETLPILAAKRTFLGRIYLDWSMYPVLEQSTDSSAPTHPLARVSFTDARFLYNVAGFMQRDRSPLGAWVTLDMQAPEGQRVVETWMGREQR